MSTFNVGMKINRAITGATTVNANAYAIVNYKLKTVAFPYTTMPDPSTSATVVSIAPMITKYFGPGQAIPAILTGMGVAHSFYGGFGTMAYDIDGGVELINTI